MRKVYIGSRREQAIQYLADEHEFQLFHGMGEGAVPHGQPKTMTGAEAKRLNAALEMKFMNTKDPNARLWRWVARKEPVVAATPYRRKYRSLESINAALELAETPVD